MVRFFSASASPINLLLQIIRELRPNGMQNPMPRRRRRLSTIYDEVRLKKCLFAAVRVRVRKTIERQFPQCSTAKDSELSLKLSQ